MAGPRLPDPVSFPQTISPSEPADNRTIHGDNNKTGQAQGPPYHDFGRRNQVTNQERIRARIARSKAKREAKRLARAEQYGRMERVMTNQHLFKSLMKRRKGTDWKQSVMDYCFHAIVRNKRAKDAVLAGAHPEPSRIKKITLYERGKRRDVHAVVIDSRVIQGAICDYCITPLTKPGLIHDNPASTIGKGVTWTRKRIMRHIRRQWRKTGQKTWALVFDIRHFFDTIRHDLCERIFREVHMDEGLISLAMHFIKMYQVFDARNSIGAWRSEQEAKELLERLERNEGVGVSLGSQISQDMALCAPNRMDHTAKDLCGAKTFIRYMDDGHAEGTKEEMKALRDAMTRAAESLGFKLHETKTHIVKLSRGFTYLKIRYTATDSGHVIRRMAKSGIVRMRRKMKRLRGRWEAGRVTLDDIFLSVKSWLGNVKKYCHGYRTRKRILAQYYSLFRGYRMEGMKA